MGWKFIVGLGNPPEGYGASRHNMGFLVVDALASAEGFPAARRKRDVDTTEMEIEGERVVLIKPRSFMNQSGGPVRDFLNLSSAGKALLASLSRADDVRPEGRPCRSERGRPGARRPGPDLDRRPVQGAGKVGDSLILVHDDLDLPLGKIRFRAQGSSGGHKGVASVIAALGTSEFGRLKVGIGREAGRDAADYVLEPLRADEKRRILDAAAHAARTLPVWIREGAEACANLFNGEAGELGSEI